MNDLNVGGDPPRPYGGAVDCDVQITVPHRDALLPYLDEYWRDVSLQRGLQTLDTASFPRQAPINARPDWRLAEPASVEDQLRGLRVNLLDRYGFSAAICNCLYGVQLLHSEDMGQAIARALNDWIAREWLDREPRLRASIVVPMQNPSMAAEEIRRVAADRRFVQVLMLVMGEMPLGKRYYWPIYEAAEDCGLPVGIHAGSMYRHPVTGTGWPSYYAHDYFSQASAFQTQLTSLILEGIFGAFPRLRVVLSETGVSWLPPYLWRLDKYWHGLRSETPWVKVPPSEIVRSRVRLTTQPFDTPADPAVVERLLDHIGSDEVLLFASDFPHWRFDGDDLLPVGVSPDQIARISRANPLATYPRLAEGVAP
ncbi:MAG TPA: amidohydrolase family protein [Kaistia sp.]|nr:amidohydrolase family protein [Kaistia sp.]